MRESDYAWFLVIQGYDALAPTAEDALARGLKRFPLKATNEAEALREARQIWREMSAVLRTTTPDGTAYPRAPKLVAATELDWKPGDELPELLTIENARAFTVNVDLATPLVQLVHHCGFDYKNAYLMNVLHRSENNPAVPAREQRRIWVLDRRDTWLDAVSAEQGIAELGLKPATLRDALCLLADHDGAIPHGSAVIVTGERIGQTYFAAIGNHTPNVGIGSHGRELLMFEPSDCCNAIYNISLLAVEP